MAYRGFTLIELMVTISILSLLIAVLLPVLATSEMTRQMMQCGTNQRALFQGWESCLHESNKGKIPHTYNATSTDIMWYTLIKRAYPEVTPMNHQAAPTPDYPYVCPVVEATFSHINKRPFYNGFLCGYAINTRWKSGGNPGDNENQPWHKISNPSHYPIFSEPAPDAGTTIARAFFGDSQSAFGQWGLAMPHQNGAGLAVFADAHVDLVQTSDLDRKDFDGTPEWFLNR